LDEISDDELRRQDGRWKSDVDLKLDKLLTFSQTYGQLLSLLLAREQSRKKFKDAVIEKSMTGLIWAGLVVVGTALVDWLKKQAQQ